MSELSGSPLIIFEVMTKDVLEQHLNWILLIAKDTVLNGSTCCFNRFESLLEIKVWEK